MKGGTVEVGIYDKNKGVVDSVPLEVYDPKLMHRGYLGSGHAPNLPGVEKWTSPDLTPSKLAQRRAVAEKVSGGTVLELFAGKGYLSKHVWAKKADKLIMLDKEAEFLNEAKRKVKGKVRHETIVANNLVWLRKVMNPSELKNVKVVDFDSFGSPATQIKRFFDNFPIKKAMFICMTDGSNIFLAFHRKRKSAHKFLRENYGVDFQPAGKREDQIRALDGLMQNQGRKHSFKVEPINVAFGKRQSVYAAYKITPKRKRK